MVSCCPDKRRGCGGGVGMPTRVHGRVHKILVAFSGLYVPFLTMILIYFTKL